MTGDQKPRVSPTSLRKYPKPKVPTLAETRSKRKKPKYNRAQLAVLPPIRFPEMPEMPKELDGDGLEEAYAEFAKEWSAFEAELDARLGALVDATGCAPQECIALALFGSRDDDRLRAFEIDMSDCKADLTASSFSRNMRLAAYAFEPPDEKSKNPKKAKRANPTKAARAMQEDMKKFGESLHFKSLRADLYKFWKERGPETRTDETPAISILMGRRARLVDELRRSAARLSGP